MSRQLQTGFYSDVLLSAIKKDYKDIAIKVTKELLSALSFFETDLSPRQLVLNKESKEYSLLAIYHNYIQRGLPTHANIEVEKYLSATWGEIDKVISDTGTIEYALIEPDINFTKQLFASLFIVDPRVKNEPLQNSYWRNWLGSDLEKRFLDEHLLKRLGIHWLQLIEPQRSVSNILSYSYKSGECVKELYNQPIDNMGEQRVDFAVELPCVFTKEGRKGMILEVDGSQHTGNRAQFNLDQYRDQAMTCLEHTQWATLRARSNEWAGIPELFNNYTSFFKDKYFEKVKANYDTPIWESEGGLKALNITLAPIGVARIQKTLIELMLNGVLSLQKDTWKIAVVERDVDCASIAIEDFKICWQNINQLSGYSIPLPTIELSIYNTKEFNSPNLYFGKLPIENAYSFRGDLLIDLSILQRWGLTEVVQTEQSVYKVTIRSAHSKKELREFISAPLIKYKPILEAEGELIIENEESVKCLEYLIQSAFRKETLRPGQLPIINKALQLYSVIGLLQTGGGKSLTYQLCALLQPGVAIVIDPIKSLMQDQNDGLKKNDIDATVFVNSSIRTHYERKWAQDQLVEGRVLFAFISPERLQIPAFRAALKQMHNTFEKYFSYCIIDEAHCVSEWGHDFRTSYLKLGENARKFCETWKRHQEISLFGLTATASFDVLSDVKRELRIGEDNVISNLNAHRKELLYRIHNVHSGLAAGATGWYASQTVGDAKVSTLNSILQQLPENIHTETNQDLRPKYYDRTRFYSINEKNKYDHAVLVFCPHKSEKSPMGVNYVTPRLSGVELKVGTFYGADRSDDNDTDVSFSETNQTKYINNELNVLVATKAFGMGIDKPNVRSTVHFNFPSSIESFVQEAGRAGRDRKRAICHVLYCSDGKHIDEGIINSFHANNFKSVEHDFEMLLELLQEITYPAQKISNEISQKVFEDLGEVIQISPWQGGRNERLYINKAYQVGYGYIDLQSLTKNLQNLHSSIGQDSATLVLDYIINYIKNKSPGNNYLEWLRTEIVGNSQPGIEVLLKKVPTGTILPDIEIGFRNNRINMITRLLKSNVSEDITEWIVETASKFCDNIKDFYANLIKEVKKRNNMDISTQLPLSDEKLDKMLGNYFYQIRSEIDSFKAIYRLSVLGVIDDYEVDYAAKSVKLHIQSKSDDQYLHNLEDYLTRYLSPKRVNEMMELVRTGNKGSVIRNCAFALIEYVYKFIGSKRARAIKEMQSICEIGISSQDHDEIERNISLYFNSKYTEELLEETNLGQEFSIEIVEKYLNETEGVADLLEHLRGSAARILSDNPDNGALLVLRAYAALLLETKFVRGKLTIRSQFLVDKAMEDLENGLLRFEENGYVFMEVLNLVRRDLLAHNAGLEGPIEELSLLLSVKQHNGWIKKFNKQFIS